MLNRILSGIVAGSVNLCQSRMHCFRVTCTTRPGEQLALTGSSPELGAWSKPGIQLLEQIGNSGVWEVRIPLSLVDQQYRYCVVVRLLQGRIIVRRWETHLLPRRVTGETSSDEFGKIDGRVSVQRGWLTEEMVIQFKLREEGINIWKRKFAGHRLWIKLTPVNHEDVHEVPDTEESMDVAEMRERFSNYPIVETAELSEEGCVRQVQAQFGVEVKREQDNFVILEVQLINLNSVVGRGYKHIQDVIQCSSDLASSWKAKSLTSNSEYTGFSTI
jgi:hypothetical protein